MATFAPTTAPVVHVDPQARLGYNAGFVRGALPMRFVVALHAGTVYRGATPVVDYMPVAIGMSAPMSVQAGAAIAQPMGVTVRAHPMTAVVTGAYVPAGHAEPADPGEYSLPGRGAVYRHGDTLYVNGLDLQEIGYIQDWGFLTDRAGWRGSNYVLPEWQSQVYVWKYRDWLRFNMALVVDCEARLGVPIQNPLTRQSTNVASVARLSSALLGGALYLVRVAGGGSESAVGELASKIETSYPEGRGGPILVTFEILVVSGNW
jgi:hypothetical protein